MNLSHPDDVRVEDLL